MKLSDLKTNENREKFIKNVVVEVKKKLTKEIATNTGLKDKEEILELIRKGKNIQFRYDILIEDVESF